MSKQKELDNFFKKRWCSRGWLDSILRELFPKLSDSQRLSCMSDKTVFDERREQKNRTITICLRLRSFKMLELWMIQHADKDSAEKASMLEAAELILRT